MRLVYFEKFVYPDAAIRREKKIKGWRRSKKIQLIESMNPRWDDLAEKWGDLYKPEAQSVDGPSDNKVAGAAREILRSACNAAPLRMTPLKNPCF